MDKVTHKVRCERWTCIINECLASGIKKTPGAEHMTFPTREYPKDCVNLQTDVR